MDRPVKARLGALLLAGLGLISGCRRPPPFDFVPDASLETFGPRYNFKVAVETFHRRSPPVNDGPEPGGRPSPSRFWNGVSDGDKPRIATVDGSVARVYRLAAYSPSWPKADEAALADAFAAELGSSGLFAAVRRVEDKGDAASEDVVVQGTVLEETVTLLDDGKGFYSVEIFLSALGSSGIRFWQKTLKRRVALGGRWPADEINDLLRGMYAEAVKEIDRSFPGWLQEQKRDLERYEREKGASRRRGGEEEE